MPLNRVLIAGCGDLGADVAKHFVALGAQVSAIRRSGTVFPSGVRGITGDLAQLFDHELPDVDLIYLIMTPQARTEESYRTAYLDNAKRLIRRYQGAQPHVVFVSSTSVYGQNKGEWIEEETAPECPKSTAQILLQTEQALIEVFPSLIARCSGIYGPGRYRMLSKVMSGAVWDANSWTNRVHRQDVVRALCFLGEKCLQGESLAQIYNITDDTPVSLWEVKLCIARLLDAPISLPEASTDFLPICGKRISNQRLKATGFHFFYPSYVSGYQQLAAEYQTLNSSLSSK